MTFSKGSLPALGKFTTMRFRLYPDCILVHGRVHSAIYDLTRGDIHILPHALSLFFNKDTIDLGPDNEEAGELVNYLNDNELGRYDMDSEIKAIPLSYNCPSIISNAIIEIDGRYDGLPLQRIASELSELLCEAVYLNFAAECDINVILESARYFESLSYRSIEIGVRYHDGIMQDVEQIAGNLQLCTKVIINNAPYNQTSTFGRDIALRFSDSEQTCNIRDSKMDYSKWAIAKLPLYLESLKYNNCLYKKVYIDCAGGIHNCPASPDSYGNVARPGSIASIVQSSNFQKLWTFTNDVNNKCRDCELRYACQHCLFDRAICAYEI